MKIPKVFNKIIVIMLSAVMISQTAVPTFAVDIMPKGFVVDNIRDGSVAFQKNNADMLYYVYQQILDYRTTIDISQYRIPYTNDYYQGIYDALSGIFPELFYLETQVMSTPTYFNENDKFFIKELKINYRTNKEQSMEMLNAFHEKADEYLAMVDDSMDDFTKALVLHDALVLNNRYQNSSEGSSDYTFMIEGWGRCENYVEVYAYLLSHAGIACEIVNSPSMSHEWMKLHLDGLAYYYNVDITQDDSLINGSDCPGKVSHDFFLLSDEMIQDADHNHYGYTYTEPSNKAFDGKTNLHNNQNPFFAVNGTLYTLYQKDDKGVIASYDITTDSFTDLYTINDRWKAGSGWWSDNYSGVAMHNGLLYFNRENSIDIFNPATGEVKNYIDNVLSDGRQLYGLYIREGKIYGLAANTFNDTAQAVNLGTLENPSEDETLTGQPVTTDDEFTTEPATAENLTEDENVTELTTKEQPTESEISTGQPATVENEVTTDQSTENVSTIELTTAEQSTETFTTKTTESTEASTTKPTETTTSVNPTENITSVEVSTVESTKSVAETPKAEVKKPNPIRVKAKAKIVKAKKLRKKSQKIKALPIKNAKGKLIIRIVKKGTSKKIYKKLKVNKSGVITLKRGKYARKTYRIRFKIFVLGDETYDMKMFYKIIKIKVR